AAGPPYCWSSAAGRSSASTHLPRRSKVSTSRRRSIRREGGTFRFGRPAALFFFFDMCCTRCQVASRRAARRDEITRSFYQPLPLPAVLSPGLGHVPAFSTLFSAPLFV